MRRFWRAFRAVPRAFAPRAPRPPRALAAAQLGAGAALALVAPRAARAEEELTEEAGGSKVEGCQNQCYHLWVKTKPPEIGPPVLVMVPFAGVPFWVPIFDPQPFLVGR